MDRATLSQRIESILNEITRLSNTLYAMDLSLIHISEPTRPY